MCSLSVDYHRGGLRCGDIELERSYMGIISMLLASIGAFHGTCSRHMANAPTVQASPF
jgi:hypothetical protein